ncbi:YqaA family protein [Terracidiphilus sp.]|uniref:YqaA family protein n=1 Tax=Terracidiphilus sp. TaxID=1964191 RepID=UPI003C1D22C4
MKQFFAHLLSILQNKWKFVIWPALQVMGPWGALLSSILDSSSIPIPMDFAIAAWVSHDKTHWWLYVLLAAAGSAIGGLLPYGVGRAGGELFLLKRINREKFEQMRNRFERQEFWAMAIPSMMPPPTPWKVFAFAAGVFEMRMPLYMLAIFVGRIVRWGLLSVLVIKFGPDAVNIVAHHGKLVAAVLALLIVVGVIVWWMKRERAATRPAA